MISIHSLNKPLKIINYDSIPEYEIGKVISVGDVDNLEKIFIFTLDSGKKIKIKLLLELELWNKVSSHYNKPNKKSIFKNDSTSISIIENKIEFFTDKYQNCDYIFIVDNDKCKFLDKPTKVIYYDSIPRCSADGWLDYLSGDGNNYNRFFEFTLQCGKKIEIVMSLTKHNWDILSEMYVNNNKDELMWTSHYYRSSIIIISNFVEFFVKKYDCNYRIVVDKKNCKFLKDLFSEENSLLWPIYNC